MRSARHFPQPGQLRNLAFGIWDQVVKPTTENSMGANVQESSLVLPGSLRDGESLGSGSLNLHYSDSLRELRLNQIDQHIGSLRS